MMMNKEDAAIETMEDLKRVLGITDSDTDVFPAKFRTGFQCLYVLKPESVLDVEAAEVTVPLMGKIWSNQGLFPLATNPEKSVFEECPFLWFAGFSETSHFDYVYFLDNRKDDDRFYFRGEYSFFGDDREDETARAFRLALSKREEYRNRETETVFHVRDFIVRIKEENRFRNVTVPFEI